jgi:MinD superfamily P-loop ATPase
MRLQLITGGKGGIGKTLFSISSILYYMYQPTSVLAVDLNYHNLDLYEILQANADRDVPLGATGFRICHIVGPSAVNHYLVYPGRSNDGKSSKAGRLPYGALGVYDDLNEILKKVGDGVGVEKGFTPTTCIVEI